MAKLEELSELLVSEIRDFEEAVKRLEKIQKDKIKLDISELQVSLEKHEIYLVTALLEVQKQLAQIKFTIENAKIYPKWVVIIFFVSIFLNVLGSIIIIFLN